MPLKVAPDPNKPGAWIWVDAATGQPAQQPGGPGTPYIAQSDAPVMRVGVKPDGTLAWMDASGNEVNADGSPVPNAQALQPLPPAQNSVGQPRAPMQPPNVPTPSTPAAPAPPPDTAWEGQILKDLGRNGWTIIGRRDETQAVSGRDENNNPTRTTQPTGNTIWTITDGRGHNQEVTVKPPGTGDTPTSAQVVKPPPDLPVALGKDQPNEGDTRSNVQGGYQIQEVYRGGQWVTDPSVPPKPWEPKLQGQPKEGDTRTDVQGGYQIQQKFTGGSWVTDPSVRPVPYDPKLQGQPKEGDTRQDVQGGYQIQQRFSGGSWVTDPSVAPKPYDPKLMNQPKENDTRMDVQNGYQVQQIYKGGQWVTDPSVRPVAWDPKLINQPKEGDTRSNVQSGYQVQEKYSGGQWVVDPSVAPKRFTPLTPQTLTAPADQPSIVRTDEQGQIQTIRNPNFQATTLPQIQGEVGRLQAQASQYRDNLSQQIRSGVLTQDQATQQFNSWWDSNIEPQRAQLTIAQQQAQQAEQQKQQDVARQNLQVAQTGAGEVLRATQAAAPPGNSPAYAAALGGILKGTKGAPQGIDYTAALSAPAPNYADVYDQATARALAHISPTAAQKVTGQPVPTGGLPSTDITGGLNRSNYQLQPGLQPTPNTPVGFQPQLTPIPNVPTGFQPQLTPIPNATPGPPQFDYAAWQQRQAADAAAQQLQVQVPFPGYTPPVYQPAF